MEIFCHTSVGAPARSDTLVPQLNAFLWAETAARVACALAYERLELLRPLERGHQKAADALHERLWQLGEEASAAPASVGHWAAAARSAFADDVATLCGY